MRVIRIQAFRYSFCLALILQNIRFMMERARLRIPQPKGVDRLGLIADDWDVVRHGCHHFRIFLPKAEAPSFLRHLDPPAETNTNSLIGVADLPYVTMFEPLFRQFDLMTVDDFLFEKPMLVANPHSMPGKVERSQ